MQVVVDSFLTHYERQGKGPSVVILHGWGDNSNGWKSTVATLAEHNEIIILDLPGFGGTESPKNAWGVGDYAEFVGNFLKKIRVKPYAVIGHSNGGAIAIRGVAQNILRPKKLILIDSAGIRSQYMGRNKALRMVTKIGKLLTSPLPRSVKKRLRHRVYSSVGSDMLVAEHLQETFKKIVTDDVQADAAQLHLPVLLIYGEDDLATPPQFGRIFHTLIDGSVLEIVPGAGHFVHLDKPDAVLKMVKDFLR